jgi:hypothetical protein
MSTRAPRRHRPAVAVPEFHPGQLLDWTGPWHWGGIELPCRYCGEDTPLRDSKRQPAHKVCAEQALAAQYAQALTEYQEGAL